MMNRAHNINCVNNILQGARVYIDKLKEVLTKEIQDSGDTARVKYLNEFMSKIQSHLQNVINNKDKKSLALLDELRKKGEPLKQNSTAKSQGSNSKTTTKDATKKASTKTKDPKEQGSVTAKKGID